MKLQIGHLYEFAIKEFDEKKTIITTINDFCSFYDVIFFKCESTEEFFRYNGWEKSTDFIEASEDIIKEVKRVNDYFHGPFFVVQDLKGNFDFVEESEVDLGDWVEILKHYTDFQIKDIKEIHE